MVLAPRDSNVAPSLIKYNYVPFATVADASFLSAVPNYFLEAFDTGETKR